MWSVIAEIMMEEVVEGTVAPMISNTSTGCKAIISAFCFKLLAVFPPTIFQKLPFINLGHSLLQLPAAVTKIQYFSG